MIDEIEDVRESIEKFSARAQGLSDDMVLWMAEDLVREIKTMIDTKQAVNEELGYLRYK
jgi:hypothetical protein